MSISIRVEPSRVLVKYKGGTIAVSGEAYNNPVDGFDYSLDISSMGWTTPNMGEHISEEDRAIIDAAIRAGMKERKINVRYL